MRRALSLLLVLAVACGDSPMEPLDGGPMVGDGGLPMPDGGDPDMGPPPPMACEEDGCGWCASKGACLDIGDECTFEGSVDGETCWRTFDPCAVSTCWDPSLMVPACGMRSTDEDFSSGSYAIHRYAAFIPDGPPVTITVEGTAGPFEPALFVTDREGTLLYGGDEVDLRGDVLVSDVRSGRGDTVASVTLTVTAGLPVHVYVTDWASVVDPGFVGMLDTSVEYRLTTEQVCASGGSDSESVGTPQNGSLENGVRMESGPGYDVVDTGRDAYYGTQETVDLLAAAFATARARHPMSATVQVRDLSILGGGDPVSGPWPHGSHESGRDADVTYHLTSGCDPNCPIADVPLATFDAETTWTLFEYWLLRDAARFIFVDHDLQAVLYDVAVARGATDDELDRWFQYPRPIGTGAGVIRHEPNHRNHHHVRFHCPPDDTRCLP
ncbi:MAG: penicillin-insensitive murein endopeptidase [Deltaproteobacteria bacterium]|nr:penicillin-insensitive murein endopeptidase [Deltaproteobacteria bacterium]